MNSPRILTCIDLLERLFVIALVPEGGRHPDRMALFNTEADGFKTTPVFSSMAKAVAFLSRGQDLGYPPVPLEYIFPAAGSRFVSDFPDYTPVLDPPPEDFFARLA